VQGGKQRTSQDATEQLPRLLLAHQRFEGMACAGFSNYIRLLLLLLYFPRISGEIAIIE
jgi:hypothetical protein